jgi:hypothetical protein
LRRPRLPQHPLVVDAGLLEELEQALAALAVGVGPAAGLFVVELHAETVGQRLDRLGEVEVLLLFDEREQVAALAAAEAVVELLARVDRERRRLFFVKRAAPHVVGAGLL